MDPHPPALVEPELSNKVMAPLWDFVAENWSEDLADAVLSSAGLAPEYVRDPAGWVSYEYARRVQTELIQRLFGLEEEPPPSHPVWQIYRQVARRSLSKEVLGLHWYALRLLGSPRLVYRAAEAQGKRFNRLSTLRMTRSGPGWVELEAWTEGEVEGPGLCASRVGFLEAVPMLWGMPMARVDHERCLHTRGSASERCVYRVHYQQRHSAWLLAALGTLAGGLLGGLSSVLLGPTWLVVGAVGGGLSGACLAGWVSFDRERRLHLAESESLSGLLTDLDQRFLQVVDSEQRFRQVVGALPQVFWLARPGGGGLRYVSPSYELLTGRPPEEAQRQGLWTGLLAEEEQEPTLETDDPAERTFRIQVPDLGVRTLLQRTFPVHDSTGAIVHIAGLAEDITESLQARRDLARQEEELRVARRLEAVGRLAGGVAHDFNNLLTVVETSARFALEGLGPDHPAQGDVERVLTATARASSLTRQLLAYSRKQVLDLSACDLNRVVGQTGSMLERILPDDVSLELSLEPAGLTVRGDEGQLAQVLMNLAVNAVDAMPQGGRLRVGTALEHRDQPLEHGELVLLPGTYALLTVEDEGSGMSEEVLERALEPFFSTKASPKGTGLGLASVAGIVGQHQGALTLHSTLGEGTRVEVRLPLSSARERPAQARRAEAPQGRGGTVLVVEDDAVLRTLATRILRRGGYRVIESRSPEEAVALGREAEALDLLLTDVVMPELSGPQVARAIREVRPELVVLYMSGYADDVVAEQGLDEHSAFLAKPYGPEQLLEAVVRALSR